MLTAASDGGIVAQHAAVVTEASCLRGRARAPGRPTLCEGDVVDGRYCVEEVLGEGGMGIVVAARHLELGHRVAIKYLRPGACCRQDAVARFRWEARAGLRIRSEHVVRVTDAGTLWNGGPYIVMELLEGVDLGQLLKQRTAPMAVEEAVDYVLQACEAMAEAHALGIVHRDLKPENLFITRRADGTPLVKVIDFGISSGMEIAAYDGLADHPGVRGHLMGSPAYMAPEQIRDFETVDARADIWSLGVILYELLTGRLTHDEQTIAVLLAKICYFAIATPRSLRPDLPSDLEQVILRCLERNPDRRLRSVSELARALLPFATEGSRSSAWISRVSLSSTMRESGTSLESLPVL